MSNDERSVNERSEHNPRRLAPHQIPAGWRLLLNSETDNPPGDSLLWLPNKGRFGKRYYPGDQCHKVDTYITKCAPAAIPFAAASFPQFASISIAIEAAQKRQ